MRLVFGLVLASLLLLPAVAAAQLPHTDETGRVRLYAHWPANLGEAQAAPIPLDEVPPVQEPDLSAGPVAPGSTATGDLPRFTFQLTDYYGAPGPLGTVELDTTLPAVLHFYLSADQVPWPSPAGQPPAELDHGVAPRVTVEATLLLGDQVLAQGHQTQDLVSLPEPAGTTVTHVQVPLALAEDTLPAGSGPTLVVELFQVDRGGQRAMQNLFNVHTGETYPTGLALPIENPEALFLSDDAGDEPLSFQGVRALTREDPESTRSVAAGTLGAALVVIAVTGVRLTRQAWDRFR